MRPPQALGLSILATTLLLTWSPPARAACDLRGLPAGTEVAELSTVLGSFCIELLRDDAPLHVDNFLQYLNNGTLAGTFFHRAVPGFIIQGGSHVLEEDGSYAPIPVVDPNTPVLNEPCTPDIPDPNNNPFSGLICSERGNERGTLALAKLGGDPNSGTTSWFINLADNRSNLDNQNGGFTVFGRVIGSGMDVLDAIEALATSADETVWMEDSLLDGTPVLEPTLSSSADAVGCFNPAIQTSVVDNLSFPGLFGVGPDPAHPRLPFHTLSLACSTAVLSDPNAFIGHPTGCANAPGTTDLISVRTTGPISTEFPSGIPAYFSLSCAQQTQTMADRDIWQAGYQDQFNSNLVVVTAANVQLATTVPAVSTVGGLLLATGILGGGCWLLRRKDEA